MKALPIFLAFVSVLGCDSNKSDEELAKDLLQKAMEDVAKQYAETEKRSPDKPAADAIEQLGGIAAWKFDHDWDTNVDTASVIQVVFSDKDISDADLVHVSKLTNLEYLDLDNTPISDAGLVHLTGLTALRSLDLRGTQVTDAGVDSLKASLPNCRISQ